MGFYQGVPEKVEKNIKSYVKFNENARMSDVLQYHNKLYREIIISKKLVSKITGEVVGSIYISEDGEIVKNEEILRNLIRISYFCEIFFDNNSNISFTKVLKDEGDIVKDKNDYDDMNKGLNILKDEGIEQSSAIKDVISQMPGLRAESSEKISNILNKVKLLKEQYGAMNDEIIDCVHEEYKDILRDNFLKVKLIASKQQYYGDIKQGAQKSRKKFRYRFKGDVVGMLSKLEHTMSYYIRIVSTYEPILNMNKSQYERHLEKIEKENFDFRMSLIRN